MKKIKLVIVSLLVVLALVYTHNNLYNNSSRVTAPGNFIYANDDGGVIYPGPKSILPLKESI